MADLTRGDCIRVAPTAGRSRKISQLYAHARYGSAFFNCLSLDLKAEFPNQTGFSATDIKYTKRWYEFYNQDDIIRQQIADDLEMPIEFGKIPWFHHVVIFTHSKSIAEAIFYVDKTIENGWSRAELKADKGGSIHS